MFHSDASYIILGGLGGIGQFLARWMCKHGAKNLIILSRSGGKHALAGKLSRDLEQAGCQIIMPACDITNAIAAERVLKEAMKIMPPIRGHIQGAMVLNVSSNNIKVIDCAKTLGLTTQCRIASSSICPTANTKMQFSPKSAEPGIFIIPS